MSQPQKLGRQTGTVFAYKQVLAFVIVAFATFIAVICQVAQKPDSIGSISLKSSANERLSRSLQQLDNKLSQSAWYLSKPRLSSAAARGSAAATRQGARYGLND